MLLSKSAGQLKLRTTSYLKLLYTKSLTLECQDHILSIQRVVCLLIVSVERREKVLREIFKAIMIAQFITPLESRLREKLLSRNADQVRTPSLISLLLVAGKYKRMYLM